jgi:hypothetical protein
LPSISCDEALHDILLNRKIKRDAAIPNEQLFTEPTKQLRFT